MKTLLYISTLLLLISCGLKNNNQTTKTLESVVDTLTDSLKVSDNNTKNKCQEYSIFKVKRISENSYPNFDYLQTFQYNDLTLLFGSYQSEPKNLPKDDFGGFRLLVINAKGELLFRSKGAGDSQSFSPKFYKFNDSSPVFILVEIGDEGGSWGNNVYSIIGNEVKDVGMIELAKPQSIDGEFSFENIAEFTHIYKLDNSFQFDFNTDSVTYDPNGKNEKKLDGKKWHYIYDNKTFKLTEK